MNTTDVSKSYHATSIEEQQAAYDAWADKYEIDLCTMGYRIPAIIASVFTRFVRADATPILDAGCGGGIQAEPLSMLGYEGIVGIDLSNEMLEVAREKRIYTELIQAILGKPLDFPSNHFSAVISCGTITPKHAPPKSFEELIRVTRPDAPIIFSMRDDPLQESGYPERVAKLETEGKWKLIFRTESFHSMPYGEPEITHRVHVYRVV